MKQAEKRKVRRKEPNRLQIKEKGMIGGLGVYSVIKQNR